jgi:PAS domain S-box-containing protein
MLKKNLANRHSFLSGALLFVLFAVIHSAYAYGSGDVNDILTPDERLWLKNHHAPIILAIETTYAPFMFLDTKGQPAGLAQDYVSLIQSKLGFQFEQRRFATLDDILEKVRSGDVQIVNAVTKTPARSEYISFTEPFISVPNVIIVRNNHSGQIKEENLSGLKVSLVKSYAVTEYLTNKTLNFVSDLVPDDLTALLHVSFGVSDATVIDLATASYLIEQKGITNLRVAGETAFNIQLAMGTTKAEPMLNKILQKGLAAITELEQRKINKRWIDVSGGRFYDDSRFWIVSGCVVFIALAFIAIVLVWNLTLRRQVDARTIALAREKEALRESEERYQSILSASPDNITITDVAGRILMVSPAGLSMFGYEREEEVAGDLVTDHLAPEDRDRALSNLTLKSQEVFSGSDEYRGLRRDGKSFDVEVRSNIIRDNEGHPTKVVIIFRDITERKQAEEALRESEQRYRNIFENVVETFYEVNIDGVILDISPSVFHLSKGQYKREDLIGKSLFNLYSDYTERKAFLEVLQKHGMVTDYEIKLKNLDGSIADCSISSKIQRDANNQPVKIIGTIVDITDHKKAEEERKILQIQLQQAQKMEAIGTLAGGIAHDFNNILGAILGYAEMAYEDSLSGSAKPSDLNQVLQASHRAKDLVKQILAFSRQAETQKIPMRPAAMVKESIKLLRSSIPTTIDIQQDIDSETDLILADPTQIHQIMMNLCTNAYHAMEETGGTLFISLKNKALAPQDLVSIPDVQPGNFVQLSIGDTGSGIAPEIQARIFDPYFTTKEAGKGTGLGLSMVHGIVKSSEGFITCHSEIGAGTVFEIYLPAISEQIVPESKELEMIPVGTEHILYIDDEEILAEMGKHMFERLGYRVTVRTNSIEALTTFQNQPDLFDLVVTDQTMPGMTGSDLARKMLQIRPGMPIILCTGFSNRISEEQARTYGIKGFAMKPLSKKDLAVLVRKVLDGEKV